MVERLCRDYGTPLLHQTSADYAALPASNNLDSSLQSQAVKPEASGPEGEEAGGAPSGLLHDLEAGKTKEEEQAVPDLAFYAFPTLQQLSKATEAALRAEGFGYRCDMSTYACSKATLSAM